MYVGDVNFFLPTLTSIWNIKRTVLKSEEIKIAFAGMKQKSRTPCIKLPSSVALAVLRSKGFFGLDSSSSFACEKISSSQNEC